VIRIMFPWWAITGVLCLSVLTVWLRLSGVQSTYEIHRFTKKKAEIIDQVSRSKVELSALKSPRRLQSISSGAFELTQPRVDQIIYIK